MAFLNEWVYCPNQAAIARGTTDLQEMEWACRVANVTRQKGFMPDGRVADLVWGERSVNYELEHRTPKEWERMVRRYRGKIRHSVIRVVWWDFISLWPSAKIGKWWDEQVAKFGSHAEAHKINTALIELGYTPYRAWKRVIKPQRKQ